MSDDELKARKIATLERTGEGIRTVGKLMWDAFTGGHDAVLESVIDAVADKRNGREEHALEQRYRCTCGLVHLESYVCPEARKIAILTEHAGASSANGNGAEAAAFGETVCSACIDDGDDARVTTFGEANVRACARCRVELRAEDRAFVLRGLERR
ncbi:MAG: hypothetical protein ACHREM_21625 [Polyangiales bacterium]